jgi:hypothetical protein
MGLMVYQGQESNHGNECKRKFFEIEYLSCLRQPNRINSECPPNGEGYGCLSALSQSLLAGSGRSQPMPAGIPHTFWLPNPRGRNPIIT